MDWRAGGREAYCQILFLDLGKFLIFHVHVHVIELRKLWIPLYFPFWNFFCCLMFFFPSRLSWVIFTPGHGLTSHITFLAVSTDVVTDSDVSRKSVIIHDTFEWRVAYFRFHATSALGSDPRWLCSDDVRRDRLLSGPRSCACLLCVTARRLSCLSHPRIKQWSALRHHVREKLLCTLAMFATSINYLLNCFPFTLQPDDQFLNSYWDV